MRLADMGLYKTLHNAINQQNDFILEIFNDKSMPESIKTKYAEKYNDLYLKTKIFLDK